VQRPSSSREDSEGQEERKAERDDPFFFSFIDIHYPSNELIGG